MPLASAVTTKRNLRLHMATETSKSPHHSAAETPALNPALDDIEHLVRSLDAADTPVRPGFCATALDKRSKPASPPALPVGYQRRGSELAPVWPPVEKSGPGWQQPKPLPKRPTGRFFVGTILAGITSAIVWHVWSTFFSVSAYGLVAADTLPMNAPWDGCISKLYVREGETVTKGGLLLTLDSPQLGRQLQRLKDELAIETSKLAAESVRLRQEAHGHTAQYYQMWAALQRSREDLARMQQELEQIRSIGDAQVVPRQALNRLVFAESGQREFVEKTAIALAALRQRFEGEEAVGDRATATQLTPIQARIDFLDGEIRRTRDDIRAGRILAPVSGVITRCQVAAGQQTRAHETLLEIVDQASLRIEMFVPQAEIDSYPPGTEIKLAVSPNATSLDCTVVGSRHRFEPAPHSIQQFYSNRETLLPVILQPTASGELPSLLVGSVTKFTLIQKLAGQ